jgi:hypothetical protein
VLDGGPVSFEQVQLWLDELSALVEGKNVHGLIQTFRRIVPEYKPSEEILALGEVDRHDVALTFRRARGQLWSSASHNMPSQLLPAQFAVPAQGNYEQPH